MSLFSDDAPIPDAAWVITRVRHTRTHSARARLAVALRKRIRGWDPSQITSLRHWRCALVLNDSVPLAKEGANTQSVSANAQIVRPHGSPESHCEGGTGKPGAGVSK